MRLHNHRRVLPLFLELPVGIKLFLLLEDNNERNLNYNFNAIMRVNLYSLPEEEKNNDVIINLDYAKKFDNLIDEFFN